MTFKWGFTAIETRDPRVRNGNISPKFENKPEDRLTNVKTCAPIQLHAVKINTIFYRHGILYIERAVQCGKAQIMTGLDKNKNVGMLFYAIYVLNGIWYTANYSVFWAIWLGYIWCGGRIQDTAVMEFAVVLMLMHMNEEMEKWRIRKIKTFNI